MGRHSLYIAFFILSTTLSAIASLTCPTDSWSCSDTLSTLNQNYPPLLQLGWRAKKDNTSRLCGPIALINGLNRLRRSNNLPLVNPWDDLLDIPAATEAIGLSPSRLKDGGIMTYDLERIAQWYLKKSGLKAETEIRGLEVSEEALLTRGTALRKSIGLDDLSVGEGELVLINFERFQAPGTDDIFPADRSLKSSWVSGHFVTLTSTTPRPVSEQETQIEVQDPDSGIHLISLKPVHPTKFAIDTLEWLPPPSNLPRRWNRAFITNILRIRIR